MNRCAEILVVEDNPGDALLLREAFNDNGSSACLSFARDGLEAMEFLRREGGFSGAPRPDLVVLDLKMPRMDGLTLLREMRSDPSLESFDVVILTGSDAPEDREIACSLGVRSYYNKPRKLDGWSSLAKRLEEIALSRR